MKKKVAVILSGCGVSDGSEINEAVLTLLAIEKQGAEYFCFAPNIESRKAIDHISNEEMAESRNVLIESARIARGQIKDLKEAKAENFDALIFPGGFGAAMNLCNFIVKKADCDILPQVVQLVKAMAQLNKPVGFMCIAPVMIPKLYPNGVKLTIGRDQDIAQQIIKMGGEHIDCAVNDIVIDKTHKVISTPAYMLASTLHDAQQGINKLVEAVLALT